MGVHSKKQKQLIDYRISAGKEAMSTADLLIDNQRFNAALHQLYISLFHYIASLDFNKYIGNTALGILVEGFYTQLNDAFFLEIGDPNELGEVRATRKNATEGAVVKGVNVELNLVPMSDLNIQAGFTVQNSEYGSPQDQFNETRFYRTPNEYGFIALDYDFIPNLCFSMSGTFTGKMLVPHFLTPEMYETVGSKSGDVVIKSSEEVAILHTTEDNFFDMGMKISYDFDLGGSKLQLATGVKNIFNAFQNDLDFGADKDPGYIYGPGSPRLIYFGIKFGNVL